MNTLGLIAASYVTIPLTIALKLVNLIKGTEFYVDSFEVTPWHIKVLHKNI